MTNQEEPKLNFGKYIDRRKFTDKAHSLWMHKIYKIFKWSQLPHDENDYKTYEDDVNQGIDYVVKNTSGQLITIQERNRTGTSAMQYNDITIRYSYPEYSQNAQLSEHFKIKADVMIYTVIGKQPTFLSELNPNQSYDKIVVINFNLLKKYIKSKHIQIHKELTSSSSILKRINNQNILLSPLRHNKSNPNDSPSDFIVFDVNHLYQIDPKIIGYDKGFNTPKDILNK